MINHVVKDIYDFMKKNTTVIKNDNMTSSRVFILQLDKNVKCEIFIYDNGYLNVSFYKNKKHIKTIGILNLHTIFRSVVDFCISDCQEFIKLIIKNSTVFKDIYHKCPNNYKNYFYLTQEIIKTLFDFDGIDTNVIDFMFDIDKKISFLNRQCIFDYEMERNIFFYEYENDHEYNVSTRKNITTLLAMKFYKTMIYDYEKRNDILLLCKKYSNMILYLFTIEPYKQYVFKDKEYNVYIKNVAIYLENNKEILSNIDIETFIHKMYYGLYFDGEIDFYNKKTITIGSRHNVIPKYIYQNKNAHHIINMLSRVKYNKNQEKLFILYEEHFTYIMDFIIECLKKQNMQRQIIDKIVYTLICSCIHGLKIDELYAIYKNIKKNKNNQIEHDFLYDFIFGNNITQLKDTFPILRNFLYYMKLEQCELFTTLIEVYRGIKLKKLTYFNEYPSWLRKFKENVYFYKKNDVDDIINFTDPRVIGNLLKTDSGQKSLKLFFSTITLLEVRNKNVYNNYLKNKKNWNIFLGWLCKYRKEIWKETRNRMYRLNSFFDYIFLNEDLIKFYNIKKFNTDMHFYTAFNNNILYHKIKINNNEIKECIFKELPITEYRKEHFKLKQILSPYDLVEEGNEMSHCVGSYIDKVLNNNSYIMSVKSNNNEQRATVEIVFRDDKYITTQIQSYENKKANKKTISFVNDYINILNNSIKDI